MPPLAGIPVGIKDVIDTKDFPTEHGIARLRRAAAPRRRFHRRRIERGRRHHPRQDGHDGARVLWARQNAQSPRSQTHARRIVIGLGGCRWRLPGAPRARYANGRIDHPPGLLLWCGRLQAELWIRVAHRRAAPIGAARHDRRLCAIGRGHRPPLRCNLRLDVGDRDMTSGAKTSLVAALRDRKCACRASLSSGLRVGRRRRPRDACRLRVLCRKLWRARRDRRHAPSGRFRQHAAADADHPVLGHRARTTARLPMPILIASRRSSRRSSPKDAPSPPRTMPRRGPSRSISTKRCGPSLSTTMPS